MNGVFQSIEQWFGPSLDTAATIVYWLAVALLAHRILAPMVRLRMDMVSAGLQLKDSLVLECPACHRETIVLDKQCAFCRKSIELPWSIKFWHFFKLRRQPKWMRWIRWAYEGAGLILYSGLTIIGAYALGAWAPDGALHQLFLGIAILCWAAIGQFVARVLHFGIGGPFGRLRDAVFAFAAAGVLSLSLFLATESRITPETVLWHVPITENGVAHVDDKSLTLAQGMIGFEYLQIDHKMLAYHRVIPLAFIGAERLEVKRSRFGKWCVELLLKRAQGYSERGLSVRSRVEQFMVASSREYEIVEREQQVYFRPVNP
ncbi:MAG: hypothetical protein ABL878_19260 [Burkholderiales bacterium]